MSKLFVYGSLGPSRPNAHILEDIGGHWEEAYVWGTLYEEGWGADMGYPGIRLEHKSEMIKGFVFSSDQLHDHWETLDRFEGSDYQRIKTTIFIKNGTTEIEAYMYALK